MLSWVTPLAELGQHKQLDADDLQPLRAVFHAKPVADKIACALQLDAPGLPGVITGLALFVSMLCMLLGPVVPRYVVSRLGQLSSQADGVIVSQQDSSIARDALLAVALLVVALLVQALANNYGNFGSEANAIQLTASVKTLMFRKTLQLSAGARKDKSMGEITNLYTADCDAILNVAFMAHQVWLIPVQIAIVSAMLFEVLDVAAFAGIAVIIAMLYANHQLSKYMFGFQRIYRKSKDARMKKVTEVFKAIGIVKFNAWEERFLSQIQETRAVEMRDLFKRRLAVSVNVLLLWGMPVFISIASFGVYTCVLHHELTPVVVFTSIALFQLIQGPMRQVTSILSMLLQSKVAFERIAAFLDMPELNPNSVITPFSGSKPSVAVPSCSDVMVEIQDGAFSWDDGSDNIAATSCVLQSINMRVHTGDFYVVHGTVGCGKSSLSSAILGEMTKRSGSVFVGGSVAYCSQQPWIQNMTIRDNILFGKPFDRAKFDKVVDACALASDLRLLPAGEYTEIGERGVNLSGGQKARVALARACYSDADIYLLDAPLAAVDAMVQNEIFHKCLLGLLRHKTIILVTHNLDIISSPLITHAVTIESANGSLVETHRVEDPLDYEPIVSPLASKKTLRFDHVSSLGPKNGSEKVDLSGDHDSDGGNEETEMKLQSPCEDNRRLRRSNSIVSASDAAVTAAKLDGKLVEEEVRVEGHVGLHVFRAYYDAVGGWLVVTVFFATSVVWQVCMIASDFWLGAWSNGSTASTAPPSTSYRLGVYSALGLFGASMILIRMLMAAVFGLSAARKMFNVMTLALLHAPMRFFDENSIGRILTRYGSDVSVVDANLPPMFARTSATMCLVGYSAITVRL